MNLLCHNNNQTPKTDNVLFQRNTLMFKTLSKFRDQFFDKLKPNNNPNNHQNVAAAGGGAAEESNYNQEEEDEEYSEEEDDMTQAMKDLLKAAGDVLEDRLNKWLENQGIAHWTPSVANSEEDGGGGGGMDSNEKVYFLTENDLREEQIALDGRPRHTPDFVFVDASRKLVQIPIILEARKESRTEPDFWSTVIEVKGHYALPSVTDDADMIKIANQLKRYVNHFGPTLMLQKRGMTSKMIKEFILKEDDKEEEDNEDKEDDEDDDIEGCSQKKKEVSVKSKMKRPRLVDCIGVVTIDLKKLPLSDLPDPFFCPIKDNYTYDRYDNNERKWYLNPNPKFPTPPQETILCRWHDINVAEKGALISASGGGGGGGGMDPTQTAAEEAKHDRNVLAELRLECFKYNEKHFGELVYFVPITKKKDRHPGGGQTKKITKKTDHAKKKDRHLYGDWEGRLFAKQLKESTLVVENYDAVVAAKASALAMKSAEDESFRTRNAELDNWEKDLDE
eukprot:CAMPEP_0114389092 /NCGR_PEP_ID=MMETSP0102-20121206/8428_1 /TAXON_ID=38822 ORGANISM="Pteridomonas danica, Strain PT" /NCGR_SAMPLE_ID=MMETSP0102 /ASSEMBLY_ACC=CAM_ASM_000212 /LENGTH=505 /DNA_ID=CAMNT_0001546877 /DNA_START=393 /DNA_END=1911 /DNA_ORIENTATION=+